MSGADERIESRVDARELRRALGQFATGVAVVTANGDAGRTVGITMSSFNSVSLDPPLVLFSLSRRAYSLPTLMDAGGYAINILARSQEHLSNRFAAPLADKWTAVDCERGLHGAPIIRGALAHFECIPYANHDGGDHVIFVGRVVRFSSSSQEEPLLFFRGRYHSVCGGDHAMSPWPLPIHY